VARKFAGGGENHVNADPGKNVRDAAARVAREYGETAQALRNKAEAERRPAIQGLAQAILAEDLATEDLTQAIAAEGRAKQEVDEVTALVDSPFQDQGPCSRRPRDRQSEERNSWARSSLVRCRPDLDRRRSS
jgi:hypothetical protein